MKKSLLDLAGTALAICFSVSVFAQTPGTLTCKFTPVAHSPCYSGTKSVMAVWIQTSAGGFVKSKLRNVGSGTKDHLPSWAVNSGGTAGNATAAACNITDATTGATLSSFTAKTITWDGKNVAGTANGTTVADGVYKVTIQETWNHGTASTVLVSYTFTKGPAPDHQAPPNDANFTNVTLDWIPTIAGPTVTTSVAGTTCNGGNNGSVTTTATGATPPYTYSWSTGATTATVTGLAAGTYTVTVKDAAGGSTTATASVTQPAALNASTTVVNISCNGGSNGSITAAPTGGTPGYTYSWNNGNTSASITGLAVGSYTLSVTYANGCVKTAVVSVTQPAVLTASATPVNVLCNGGSTGSSTVTATGGTAAYTYSWNNGKTTATATGLAAGSYTVTITDAKACSKTASVTITQPATALTSSVTTTTTNCGAATGTANATATGGTGTYTYTWSNGKTTANITGLAANTYTAIVTDANGCTSTTVANVLNTGAPTASVTSTNVTGCFGGKNGSATVSATGGTGALTYSWNTSPVQTTATATGLVAGTYSVKVTDANGCIVISSAIITQPTAIISSATSVKASTCTAGDGSLSVTVSGGSSPYTYLWSNGKTAATITGLLAGNYTLTITDSKSCTIAVVDTVNCVAAALVVTTSVVNVKCNGAKTGSATATPVGTPPYSYTWSTSPVQTTATATGLGAGTYTVTVKDANGTKTQTVTVTDAAAIVPNTTASNTTSCSATDGTIITNVAGGTYPYTYLWSNGKTTPFIIGLSIGTYTVTITDAGGCTVSSTGNVSWTGSATIPLAEGFESGTNLAPGWKLYNPDNDAAWVISTTVSRTGTNCIGFDNCDGNSGDMTGTVDRFITTSYDFSNATATANMSFDVAYALLNYKGQVRSDTLAIYASLDCGNSWNRIYQKGGTTLSNNITTLSCWTPASTDWKTENVTLGNLAGQSNVMFAFENRSGWGEWIYIDNININAITGIEPVESLSGFSIYPNPATGSFTIEGTGNAGKIHYAMYNVIGDVVRVGEIAANGNLFREKIQLNDISKGLYFVTLSDGKNTSTKKLNVQ